MRSLVNACTSLLAVALAVVLLPPPPAGATETIQRTYGPDRIATSVSVSADHRTAATDALLATAGDFPDALAAGVVAGRLDAPLLLTNQDHLPDIVADELDRLGVERVWLLGGPGAISTGVETELLIRGHDVRRLAGSTRYGTAATVALQAGPSSTGEVIVALGDHADAERAWADAVSSGALAGAPGYVPTLLTRQDSVPAETREALEELNPRTVLLLGGNGAIEAAAESQLRDLGYDVQRLYGTSRYETSVAVAELAVQRANGTTRIVFASGSDFPDALSAGALSASAGGPLVLVPPSRLSDSVDDFVRLHRDRWNVGVLVGGPSAASDWVVRELSAAMNGQPRPQPEPDEPEERVVGVFEGTSSWYGGRFHGRTTACGEVFDRNALTAAHRTLPCGTRVRVTNTSNGAQVIVRINDRGPYSGGRVLDVSERAAHDLGFASQGTTWVRGEILE
jgi:rare lipoprotein A